MTINEIEKLIRRYLTTGVAVVVIVTGPGAQTPDLRGVPGDPQVVTVDPTPVGTTPSDGITDPRRHPGTSSAPPTTPGTPPPTEPDTGLRGTGGDPATATAGTTAAERFGWGVPNRVEEFHGVADRWSIYDGPGHAGQGTRSPSAVSVADGILTITGDSSGTTAGMAWLPGQMYGRWEGRVRAPASDPSYNALLLLWPDAENFPIGGEIDFMEMMDHTRQTTNMFLHYGADNSQISGEVEIDATQWHNWALEWTPEAITAFVDGQEWFRTTDTGIFPPGPMHLCIQLDWFPHGSTPRESRMEVDWVRQYSLDGGPAARYHPLPGVGSQRAHSDRAIESPDRLDSPGEKPWEARTSSPSRSWPRRSRRGGPVAGWFSPRSR
ncbi:glycoside hydrolase family 16 protein [Pseudonocardia hispaniensis]|uniref:Glycoside hydrolase family 16 protein n=1 Tax=Pseudonocardia hispaniensis TaxID=904933 RepID=A0ABW1J497_9PSEU